MNEVSSRRCGTSRASLVGELGAVVHPDIRLSTEGFRDRALQHQLLMASIVVVAALLARR
jgi:hypothetical protein